MSAQKYTPTTEEVRSGFDAARLRYAGAKDGDLEFDRWLAAHDAEVAAKALEEAALLTLDALPVGSPKQVITQVAAMLTVRAAEIRKVATDE